MAEDDNILEILDKLDQIVSLRIDLAKKLSDGWMSLAKHRYNNAASHGSSTSLRMDFDPTTLMDPTTFALRFIDADGGETSPHTSINLISRLMHV
jgi:hypothetical protein